MSQEKIYPDFQFIREVEKNQSFLAEACFQCRKCTSGCPVAFAMDLFPDEVIRFVILGQRDKVLTCQTIWVCAGCETCTTRCPNEVKIAELMDRLKEMALEENLSCPQPQVKNLHQTFLNNIRKHGRVFETTLLPTYWLKSGKLYRKFADGSWQGEARLGWKMLKKGRMPLRPGRIEAKKTIKRILAGPQPKRKGS
jgi:heterodisulfide reductase subunit C